MAILTIPEVLDVLIMSLCVGFIFSAYFSRFNTFRKPRDYVQMYGLGKKFNWSDILFSSLLFAPAIVLHELGHKFLAIYFGYDATFFSAISVNKLFHGMPFLDFPAILMIFAIAASYIKLGFLFFIPAYVSFSALATPFQQTLIAFAGPLVNLILWLGSRQLIKMKKVKQKYIPFAIITSKINMFLFIFNMIPIPGFDGSKVLLGLISLFS